MNPTQDLEESFHPCKTVRNNANQAIHTAREHGPGSHVYSRKVSFGTCGDSTGIPVLIFPPVGGCRFIACDSHEDLERRALYGIIVDRPGVGKTTTLPSCCDESTHAEEHCKDVISVLDFLKIRKKVVLLGMCAGSRYIFPFMRYAPERVNPHVAGFQSPFISPNDCDDVSTSMKIVNWLPTPMVRGGHKLILESFNTMFSTDFGRSFMPRQSREVDISTMLNEIKGNEEAPILMQSWGDASTWKDFTQKFFVFTGAQDEMIPLAATQWLHSHLPETAELHVEPFCLHGDSFLANRMCVTFDFLQYYISDTVRYRTSQTI